MPNVNHRYSSQTWTLDLSAQRSPLSRWTGRDVLRKEEFRLSLLGAESGVAPVVWLSGDRPCFEQLYLSLENYVQRGLSQPLLAAESAFPAVDVQPVSGAAPNPARGTPVEPGQESGLGQEPAIAPPSPAPFSIIPLGLLRHQLTYQPPASTSPRQMQLSTLQLADLLSVLDQWQQQTSALPESRSGLSVLPGGAKPGGVKLGAAKPDSISATQTQQARQNNRQNNHEGVDFVVPLWGRIAVSLVIASSVAGAGIYAITQGGSTQVALETGSAASGSSGAAGNAEIFPETNGAGAGSPFGSFPSAGGPPLTTQSDPAAGAGLPVPESSADGPPSPNFVFPTGGGSTSNAGAGSPSGAVVGMGQTESSASMDAGGSISGNSEANSGQANSGQPNAGQSGKIDNRPSTTANAPINNSPGTVASPGSGSSNRAAAGSDAPSDGATASGFSGSGLLAQSSSADQADAPLISPSSAPAARSQPGATTTADALEQAPGNAQTLAKAAPPVAPAASRPASSAASNTAGAASSSPNLAAASVTEPLPTNIQSEALQNYLQSNWTPASGQTQQYRVAISPEGKLTSVQALGSSGSGNFPKVGAAIAGAAAPIQSTLKVTVTSSGRVVVLVERENPAP